MSAYVIIQVKVTDPEAYKGYADRAPATIEMYGGTYLSRGGRTVTLEGEENTTRNHILEFDSVEAAETWFNSREYSEAKAHRHNAAVASFVVIEGTYHHYQS